MLNFFSGSLTTTLATGSMIIVASVVFSVYIKRSGLLTKLDELEESGEFGSLRLPVLVLDNLPRTAFITSLICVYLEGTGQASEQQVGYYILISAGVLLVTAIVIYRYQQLYRKQILIGSNNHEQI